MPSDADSILSIVSKEFDLPQSVAGNNDLSLRLAEVIEEMLQKEFYRLLNILYRLDVDEQKLKAELEKNAGVNASLIIANLIIERQLQKIKSRQQFRGDNDIAENEKW